MYIEYISFTSKFGKSMGLRPRRSASSLALLIASCVTPGLIASTSPGVASMAQLLGEGRH